VGRLLKRGAREAARKRERARRAALLEAAAHTFAHTAYADVDLDAIGRRAGVPTGMTSAYVGSREELYLVVLRKGLDPWLDEVGEWLASSEDPVPPGALVDVVAASLAAREDLVRLLGLLPTVLEHNVEPIPAMEFMSWIRDRVQSLGAATEARCPDLGPGGGIAFLLRLQIVLGGLPLERNLSGMFAAALEDVAPGLAGVDRSEVLRDLASRLLGGRQEP
jgi:AcrR family transcriptional regulator